MLLARAPVWFIIRPAGTVPFRWRPRNSNVTRHHMRNRVHSWLLPCVVGGWWLLSQHAALAQGAPAPAPAASDGLLFVAEIKVGPKWDATKPPNQQLHFADHSANLRRLREAGKLVIGARYSDKGLVVLSAASEAEARAMLDPDPSFQAGVFAYELHPFNVFYSGSVQARSRQPSPK